MTQRQELNARHTVGTNHPYRALVGSESLNFQGSPLLGPAGTEAEAEAAEYEIRIFRI